MKYKVFFSQKAVLELKLIKTYISRYSEKSAIKYLEEILSKIELLEEFPYLGKNADTEFISPEYRCLIVEKYVVFYLVLEEEQTIKIIDVISQHQNYKKVLFK